MVQAHKVGLNVSPFESHGPYVNYRFRCQNHFWIEPHECCRNLTQDPPV